MLQQKDVNEKQIPQDQAFDALERIIKAAPELDDEKELASWREDRFLRVQLDHDRFVSGTFRRGKI